MFQQKLCRPEGVEQYIQNAKRKKLPINNTLPRKVIIQSEGKRKNFPDKQKLNYHH